MMIRAHRNRLKPALFNAAACFLLIMLVARGMVGAFF